MGTSRNDDRPSEGDLVLLAAAILEGDALTEPRTDGPVLVEHGTAKPGDELVGAVEPAYVNLEPYRIIENYERIAKAPEVTLFRAQLARLVLGDFRFVEGELELDGKLGRDALARIMRLVEPPVIVLRAPASEAGVLRYPPPTTSALKSRFGLLVVGAPIARYVIEVRLGLTGGGLETKLELAGSVYRRGHARPTAHRVRFKVATDDWPIEE